MWGAFWQVRCPHVLVQGPHTAGAKLVTWEHAEAWAALVWTLAQRRGDDEWPPTLRWPVGAAAGLRTQWEALGPSPCSCTDALKWQEQTRAGLRSPGCTGHPEALGGLHRGQVLSSTGPRGLPCPPCISGLPTGGLAEGLSNWALTWRSPVATRAQPLSAWLLAPPFPGPLVCAVPADVQEAKWTRRDLLLLL